MLPGDGDITVNGTNRNTNRALRTSRLATALWAFCVEVARQSGEEGVGLERHVGSIPATSDEARGHTRGWASFPGSWAYTMIGFFSRFVTS